MMKRLACMLLVAAVLVACGRAGSATGPQPGPSVEGGWLADSLTGTDFTWTGFELHESASGVITGKAYTAARNSSSRPIDDVTGMRDDSIATFDWTANDHIVTSYRFSGKVTADSMIGTLTYGQRTYPQKLHRS